MPYWSSAMPVSGIGGFGKLHMLSWSPCLSLSPFVYRILALFGSSSLVHDFTVTCKADSCHKLSKHGKVDFLTILTNWNHGRHPRTQSQNQSQSHCDTEPMFTNDWFLSAWWLVWAREFSWWPLSLLSIWGQLLPILADRLTINLSTGLSSASDF